MQHQSADQLHIEVPHAGRAHAGFADQGEGFRQNFHQRFLLAILAIVFVTRVLHRIGDLCFKESRPFAHLLVGKLLHLRLEFID